MVEPQKNQYAASSQSDQSQTALLSSSRSVQKNQYCSNAVSPLGNPLQQLQHGLTPDSLLQLCLHSAENQSTLQTAAVDGTHEPKNMIMLLFSVISGLWRRTSAVCGITGSQRIILCYCGNMFPFGSLAAIHLCDLKTQCGDWMVVIKMFPWFETCSALGFRGK